MLSWPSERITGKTFSKEMSGSYFRATPHWEHTQRCSQALPCCDQALFHHTTQSLEDTAVICSPCTPNTLYYSWKHLEHFLESQMSSINTCWMNRLINLSVTSDDREGLEITAAGIEPHCRDAHVIGCWCLCAHFFTLPCACDVWGPSWQHIK